MMELPILFNDEMVRATLDGRKSQTRRPVKPQPYEGNDGGLDAGDIMLGSFKGALMSKVYAPAKGSGNEAAGRLYRKPYYGPFGRPGDTLWVKECWRFVGEANRQPYGPLVDTHMKTVVAYPASGDTRTIPGRFETRPSWFREGNIPSIHMPRWASRISLEVVRVWVERVKDISEADALAEGVRFGTYNPGECRTCASGAFMDVWNSLYEKKGIGWRKNPWVWACEFKRLEAT